MIEDQYFLDQGQVYITAASVGIGRMRWTSIKECEIGRQQEIMTENRFDHLPIVKDNGFVNEFFKTKQPNNYDDIERHKIGFDDVIALDTDIREVIDKFSEERTFYFLRFHQQIVGLITIGNLNCKQVQVYLFNLICELERRLADFLNSKLTKEQILQWLSEKPHTNGKYKKIIKQYEKLCEVDLENQVTEHFYLIDFFTIIKDHNLFTWLDYSDETWTKNESINNLRNKISHPTRSLLDRENTIATLKERLNDIEDLLFRLSNYQQSIDNE